MKQITEDYVSYEIAVLLKEKGFDSEPTRYYRVKDGIIISSRFIKDTEGLRKSDDFDEKYIQAPSQSLALKWLREVHHYYIQIMLDSWACGDHLGYYVVIQKTDSDFEMMLQDAVDEVFYQTYEQAVEAAILYVLKNLI